MGWPQRRRSSPRGSLERQIGRLHLYPRSALALRAGRGERGAPGLWVRGRRNRVPIRRRERCVPMREGESGLMGTAET